MLVRDAMAKTIATADPSTTIRDVALMMRREDCGFIPVLRDDRPVGVVTDRDLVIRYLADGAAGDAAMATPVGELMSSGPICVQVDADLEAAGHVMAEHQVRRLCVLDGSRMVGVLSFGNLEQALHAHGTCAEEVMLGVTVGA